MYTQKIVTNTDVHALRYVAKYASNNVRGLRETFKNYKPNEKYDTNNLSFWWNGPH
jgi:hypothetical protein